MADRTITLRITANVADLLSKLKTAEASTSKWVTKNKADLGTLSTGLLGIGVAAVAGVGVAVKKFADFDQAMAGVQAATMETTQNMGLLREAALKAGADTMYTASEAAAAITDLAKAGVSTSDILRGGLMGSLNLAAAAQMDVAQAAEITATAMNQFGLKGSDAAHISDLLAAASGKAMGDVTDMAQALKFVGPVAHQMGVSIEETTGTIAELAQQGILGEQAGTSLRGMLMALTSPSKIAAAEMDNLGIKVYDARGNFIGLAGIAQEMQDKMKGLTNAERDEAFGRIFGNEQITTARILYAGGSSEVQKWTDAVNTAGYAQAQASIKTNNLKGDIERLGGSLDTVLIQSGSGANSMLRQMTQSAEGFVNQVGEMPQSVLQIATLALGVSGGAALAVGGLGKMVIAINSARTAMVGLGLSIGTATLAAAGIGAVLGVATMAFAGWSAKQQQAKQRTDDFRQSLDASTGAITDNTRAIALNNLENDGMVAKARSLGIRMDTLVSASLDPTSSAMDRLRKASQDATAAWRASQANDVNSGMGMQMSEQTRQAEQSVNDWKVVLGELGGQQEQVKASQQKWRDAQEAGISTTHDSTSATEDNRSALEKLTSGTNDSARATSNFVQALSDLIDAQSKAANNALSEQESQIAYRAALDAVRESIKENGRSLDITTEKGRANKSALLDVADAGWKVITSMQANGATQAELQATMATTRQGFIDAAGAFGMSKDQAAELADQLNLIPDSVTVSVAVDTANAQKAVDNFIGLNNSRAILLDVGGTVARAGQRVARAHGGILPGAPSSRDNMLIAAASGEFVVNAAATSRNRSTLEAINSGAPGYANGGYVAPQYMSVPLTPAPVAISAGSDQPTLLVEQMVVADSGAAVREMRHELAMAWGGVRR